MGSSSKAARTELMELDALAARMGQTLRTSESEASGDQRDRPMRALATAAASRSMRPVLAGLKTSPCTGGTVVM